MAGGKEPEVPGNTASQVFREVPEYVRRQESLTAKRDNSYRYVDDLPERSR